MWNMAGITAYSSREHDITLCVLVRSVLVIFLVLVLPYNMSLCSEFHVVMSVTMFVGGLKSYLRYLC